MIKKIENIFKEAFVTFKRFPIEILIAVVGSLSAIYLVDLTYDQHDYPIQNLLHTCLVGLTFALSVSIYSERKKFDIKTKAILQAVVVALLVAYYFYLPQDELPLVYIIRALALFIAFHLLVSFSAFVQRAELLGFWEFNKQLFVNILISGLYSGVLYVGLSLALVAIDNLFNANLDSKIYAYLFITLAGIFNTWFFLSKFPEDYENLEQNMEYPKGLKLFTQYVLLPLVVIYLVILYFYEFKIILEWQLPMGWVSYLVIAFSIAGILALLLVYPLQYSDENKWVRVFTRSFYWALFPLIGLFFVAIVKRVAEYGITENRYFLILLAFWLLATSVYLLIDKLKNIKIIPISLAVIALLSIVGPWGAFSVSKYSQLSRLEKLLSENNLLKDGKIIPLKDTISFEAQKEISSKIDYLVTTHGIFSLEKLFAKPMQQIIDSTVSKYSQSDRILKEMNLEYVSRWQAEPENNFNYNNYNVNITNVSTFDYMIDFNYSDYSQDKNVHTQGDSYDSLGVDLKFDFSNQTYTIVHQEDSVNINIASLIDDLAKSYKSYESDIPLKMFVATKETTTFKAKLIFSYINGTKKEKQYVINNLSGKLLIGKKQLTKEE